MIAGDEVKLLTGAVVASQVKLKSATGSPSNLRWPATPKSNRSERKKKEEETEEEKERKKRRMEKEKT